jgi:hypothetical protein
MERLKGLGSWKAGEEEVEVVFCIYPALFFLYLLQGKASNLASKISCFVWENSREEDGKWRWI